MRLNQCKPVIMYRMCWRGGKNRGQQLSFSVVSLFGTDRQSTAVLKVLKINALPFFGLNSYENILLLKRVPVGCIVRTAVENSDTTKL